MIGCPGQRHDKWDLHCHREHFTSPLFGIERLK